MVALIVLVLLLLLLGGGGFHRDGSAWGVTQRAHAAANSAHAPQTQGPLADSTDHARPFIRVVGDHWRRVNSLGGFTLSALMQSPCSPSVRARRAGPSSGLL